MYQIRVPGRLNPVWSDYLHGMTVSTMEADGQTTVTELIGTLPDQAALMGVLQQLYNCIIPLLSVECLSISNPVE
jgi:hypothetical protein